LLFISLVVYLFQDLTLKIIATAATVLANDRAGDSFHPCAASEISMNWTNALFITRS